MTNKQLKKFFWQIGLYGCVLIYLACDLFVFNGPLAKSISARDPRSAEAIALAKAGGVVARVFNHSITRSQVERAARERLWRLGQIYEQLPANQQVLVRYAALDDLIDHELLRVKAMVHTEKLIVDPEEVDARVERFRRRFPSDETLTTGMRSQGIKDMQELRERIAAQMQQEAYIRLRINPQTKVTEQEAREWFEQNREAIANPEHRRLRHIFVPSLSMEKQIAMSQLANAKTALESGEVDFASLAREISQDPASRHEGGELGWVHRERLPEDFADAVWALPLKTPTIIESKIGWHLVEVLEHQALEGRRFDQAKEEIIAAIRSVKRREAIKQYRKDLREWEKHRVIIYHDMMK